jgi:hypothetical protein
MDVERDENDHHDEGKLCAMLAAGCLQKSVMVPGANKKILGGDV